MDLLLIEANPDDAGLDHDMMSISAETTFKFDWIDRLSARATKPASDKPDAIVSDLSFG